MLSGLAADVVGVVGVAQTAERAGFTNVIGFDMGGPLTVTDCNVILGRLQPAFFPAAFGPGADQPK